jgi:hypothetical protein
LKEVFFTFTIFYSNFTIPEIPQDMYDKLVGSHWTMTVWLEGAGGWGVHFVCQGPMLKKLFTSVI